jgi:hypothetical protein
VDNPEGERQLGGARRTWTVIEMDLKKTGDVGVTGFTWLRRRTKY